VALDQLPVSWLRIAGAVIIPVAVVLPTAHFLWKRQEAIVGNAVGALVLFLGFLVFGGSEYVDAMAYRKWCQTMNQPCPISSPSDFVRMMMFGMVTMAQIMGLFVLSDIYEARRRRR
jgi:hypothetical protein